MNKTLTNLMESASHKPMQEWTLAEILAYEIVKNDSKIRVLNKELREAEEHSSRLKKQFADVI